MCNIPNKCKLYKIKLYFIVFETYQKARLVFVQTMAELATRATNVKCLESAGVLGNRSFNKCNYKFSVMITHYDYVSFTPENAIVVSIVSMLYVYLLITSVV